MCGTIPVKRPANLLALFENYAFKLEAGARQGAMADLVKKLVGTRIAINEAEAIAAAARSIDQVRDSPY